MERRLWRTHWSNALPLGDLSWELQPLQTLRRGSPPTSRSFAAPAHASGERGAQPLRTPHRAQAVRRTCRSIRSSSPACRRSCTGMRTWSWRTRKSCAASSCSLPVRSRCTTSRIAPAHVTPLGSYVVSFPEGGGEPLGQVHDLGGPLSVEGTLRLTRQGGFDVQSSWRRAGSGPRACQQHPLPGLAGSCRPAGISRCRARSSATLQSSRNACSSGKYSAARTGSGPSAPASSR